MFILQEFLVRINLKTHLSSSSKQVGLIYDLGNYL